MMAGNALLVGCTYGKRTVLVSAYNRRLVFQRFQHGHHKTHHKFTVPLSLYAPWTRGSMPLVSHNVQHGNCEQIHSDSPSANPSVFPFSCSMLHMWLSVHGTIWAVCKHLIETTGLGLTTRLQVLYLLRTRDLTIFCHRRCKLANIRRRLAADVYADT